MTGLMIHLIVRFPPESLPRVSQKHCPLSALLTLIRRTSGDRELGIPLHARQMMVLVTVRCRTNCLSSAATPQTRRKPHATRCVNSESSTCDASNEATRPYFDQSSHAGRRRVGLEVIPLHLIAHTHLSSTFT